MHRQLAAVLGCTQSDAKQLVRLSSAELPSTSGGASSTCMPSSGGRSEQTLPVVSPEQLVQAALRAANGVTIVHPRGAARWGEQIDVQVLERSEKQRAKAVASYVAKYATKSSDDSGALDVRIRSEWDLAKRRLPAHLHRMAEVSWELGGVAAFEQWHLRRHAHSLGYGGHFLSKSKGYSTTLGALRAARQQWQVERACKSVESDDRSLHARWRAVGIGWANEGEATWAEAQRRRREDERRCALEDFYSRERPEWPASGAGSRSDAGSTTRSGHERWRRAVGPLARCECGRTRPESYGTPLIDIAELARWLATSQRHVRRLVEEQRVPYLKIGHYVRFDPTDIEAWLDQQRVSTADGETGKDGPPWVRLSHGAHGKGRGHRAPKAEPSEIEVGDPPWLRYRAAAEG